MSAITPELEVHGRPWRPYGELVSTLTLANLCAWFEGAAISVFETRELNPGFAVLEVRSASRPRIGESGALHWLDTDGEFGPVDARVVAERIAANGGASLVFELAHGDVEAAREFVRWLHAPRRRTNNGCSWLRDTVVTQPARVLGTLDRLCQHSVSGSVPGTHGARRVVLREQAQGRLRFSTDTDVELSRLAEFALGDSLYTLPLIDVRPELDGSSCMLPPWLTKRATRRLRRGQAPRASRVQFDHPRFAALRVDRELIGLSLRGLSWWASPTQDLLYEGLQIPRMHVAIAGHKPIALRARICSVTVADRDDWSVVGCEIEPVTLADRLLWQRHIESILYPETSTRGRLRLWDVFEQAGYFQLSGKQAADFQSLRSAHRHSSQLLSKAPHLGCQVSWPAVGRPRATITHLRIYSKTWLISQLSKSRAGTPGGPEGRVILERLYKRAYEQALAQSDTTWFLVYVKDDAPRWSHQLHERLPRRLEQAGDACVLPFHAWEVAAGSPRASPGPFVIASPTQAELEVLLTHLTSSRPLAYREALDLTPASLSLDDLAAAFAEGGLARQRELLVARANGTPVAFAVLELAEPGLHLFRLLDCLRIYVCGPGGALASDDLLDAARAWFSAQGRDRFVYLEEPGARDADVPRDAVDPVDAVDLGRASLSVFHARHIADFFEQVEIEAESLPPVTTR